MSQESNINYEIKNLQDYENILKKMLKLGIECEIQKNKKSHLIKVPKEFVGKETDFDCEGEIINSERSLKCILTKQENENLEIKLRLIEYIDIPNKIKDLYKTKNDISLKIRDLRNNIIDIYNHSSVIEKLEEKHLQESKSELENSLPDKDESITKDNTIAEIPKEYQEDFNNLKKEYSDNEKEIEFLKIFYNKKMDYLEKRLYDLEMIRDKLENKIREIYHSIVNKIKIKYFKKTNLDSDKLILYPEDKNETIYFDLETSIAYEKLGEESYMKVGLVINNELVIDDKVKEMEIELRKMTNKLSGNINIDNEIQFQLKIYNNLKQILENVVNDPIKKINEAPKKGDIIKFLPKDIEETATNLETTDNSCVYDNDNLLGLILDKQDNNYLIKTFKGEYTNCNENLFVKISPIKNEIQYIKEQLQKKSKKITVEKYNECLETLELPTIKTKKPKVTISNNNFLNQDAEMLIQEFISTLDSENTIFKQDDDFDCTSLADMPIEAMGQIEKTTSNVPIDYLPIENQIDGGILNEIHMYLNKFDVSKLQETKQDMSEIIQEDDTTSEETDDSDDSGDSSDEGIKNYSEQIGSGFYTVNNRKANSLNIIAKNYFDDLSSTSSYEEIQESQYGGNSLNESSLDSDNVIRIKSFLLPNKKEETKKNNFKTIKLEISSAQSKKLLKEYLD